MSGSENILNFIISPITTMRGMTENKYYPSSFVTIFISVLSLILSLNIVSGKGLTVSMLLTRFSVLFLGALCIWIACASCYHLFAEMTGGSGHVITLLSLIGLSTAPLLLLTPMSLLIMFIGTYSGMLYMLTLCSIFMWALILVVRSISVHYSLRSIISIGIVGAPLYIIPLIIFILILLLIIISKISGSLNIVTSFGN